MDFAIRDFPQWRQSCSVKNRDKRVVPFRQRSPRQTHIPQVRGRRPWAPVLVPLLHAGPVHAASYQGMLKTCTEGQLLGCLLLEDLCKGGVGSIGSPPFLWCLCICLLALLFNTKYLFVPLKPLSHGVSTWQCSHSTSASAGVWDRAE